MDYPKLEQSLNSERNFLPLAAYLDSQQWPEFVGLPEPNVTSFKKRTPNTVFVAEALTEAIGLGYRWGREYAPKGWDLVDAGKDSLGPRFCGAEKVGVEERITVPLLPKYVFAAFTGHGNAVAVSDRYSKIHEGWVKDAKILSPWDTPTISSIRFDIDFPGGWQRTRALEVCRTVKSFGDTIGLMTRSFSTGNRGVQIVFNLPTKVTIRIATGLAALLRESLIYALGDLAVVDADSTSSILRIPGCNHAKTKFLALYIDVDNKCFFDAASQANLIASGFRTSPPGVENLITNTDFETFVSSLTEFFDDIEFTHDCRIRNRPLAHLLVDSLSQSNFILISEAKSAMRSGLTVPSTELVSPSTSVANDQLQKAEHRFQNPPAAGETWQWMTQSFGGVWAAKVLYGDGGLDELLKLLSQVPSGSSNSNREREITARKLWDSFKLFPSIFVSEFHPDDVAVTSLIASIACEQTRIYRHKSGDSELPISIKLLNNIVYVSYVMLYCLRQSDCADFKLSSRNGATIVEKVFGVKMSKNTFDSVCQLLLVEQRHKSTVRAGRYSLEKSSEPFGNEPFVPVFERGFGTTAHYKAGDWLIERFNELRNR
jgi:hypothetical protein